MGFRNPFASTCMGSTFQKAQGPPKEPQSWAPSPMPMALAGIFPDAQRMQARLAQWCRCFDVPVGLFRAFAGYSTGPQLAKCGTERTQTRSGLMKPSQMNLLLARGFLTIFGSSSTYTTHLNVQTKYRTKLKLD